MLTNNEQSNTCSKYNRRYSEQLKRQMVKLIVKDKVAMISVSRQFGVSRASLYKWIYRYSDRNKGTRMVMEMDSQDKQVEKLLKRVAELERVVGQKQLEIDVLSSTIDFIEEDLELSDLKKIISRVKPMARTRNVAGGVLGCAPFTLA